MSKREPPSCAGFILEQLGNRAQEFAGGLLVLVLGNRLMQPIAAWFWDWLWSEEIEEAEEARDDE
jgi:hypothetical protein